jgi:hypothetical protein
MEERDTAEEKKSNLGKVILINCNEWFFERYLRAKKNHNSSLLCQLYMDKNPMPYNF